MTFSWELKSYFTLKLNNLKILKNNYKYTNAL